MIDGASFDTNILIYYIDTRDAAKHNLAKRLVDAYRSVDCLLSVQALNEFFHATTKRRLLDAAVAAAIVNDLRTAMMVAPILEADLMHGIDLQRREGIQFYDALLLATVGRTGATTLFSEDMQHLHHYDGVQVVNPFQLSGRELKSILDARSPLPSV